jgi:molecular chaperone DnaK (HSP70)
MEMSLAAVPDDKSLCWSGSKCQRMVVESIDNDEPLGVVELDGLPKGPRGSIAVVVTLRVTAQQVLEIEARETKSGKSVRAKLATRHTADTIRRKLGLPATPTHDQLKNRKPRRRPAGVWGWLTSLFGRKS